jgi:hypothetical protein
MPRHTEKKTCFSLENVLYNKKKQKRTCKRKTLLSLFTDGGIHEVIKENTIERLDSVI